MKITQGKAVAIIQTIGNISKQAIPLEAARELFRMKKALMSAQEFQYEQQEKYVQECNAHMDGNQVIFETGEQGKHDREAFLNRMLELAQMEQEFDIEPVQIKCDRLEVSVEDLETLDGVIEFI